MRSVAFLLLQQEGTDNFFGLDGVLPRLIQKDEVYNRRHLLVPLLGLEWIELSEHLEFLDPSEGDQLGHVADEVVADVKVLQFFQFHDVFEATLEAIVGYPELLKGKEIRKVVQVPEITLGDLQVLQS